MKSFVIRLLPVVFAVQFALAAGGPSCESATVVTSVPFRDEGVLDVSNGPSCIGDPVNDVFYTFTAPAADTYRFTMTGSTNSDNYRMRLWTDGTCCSGNSILIELGSIDQTPGHPLALTQGQTVVIEIGVIGLEQVRDIAYTFQIFRLPDYADICPGVEVTELPFSHFQPAAGIQNEVNLCGTTQSGPDQFFRVEFAETRRCLVSSCLFGSEDTIIEIVQSVDGTCFNSFSVACNDNACGTEARLTYTFLANTVYYIVLDHRTPAANFMNLLVEEERDSCLGRVIENIPFYITGNTNFSADDLGSCNLGGNRDDVYRFTPASTALLDVSTCGSSFNTVLQIYESPFGSCNNLNPVACNDNACGLQSQLRYQFVAGVTYLIVVDGAGSESGYYELSVTPPGDECATAIPLLFSGTHVAVNGSTIAASNSSLGCGVGIGPDVFYRVTNTSSTCMDVLTEGIGFSPYVDAYTGTCGNLTPAFVFGDSCGAGGRRTLVPASEYYLRIDDSTGASGNFTLHLFRSENLFTLLGLPFYASGFPICDWGPDRCGQASSAEHVFRYSRPNCPSCTYLVTLCNSPGYALAASMFFGGNLTLYCDVCSCGMIVIPASSPSNSILDVYVMRTDPFATNPYFLTIELSPFQLPPGDLTPDSLTIIRSNESVVLNWTGFPCEPIEYHIYRSTTPDVEIIPTNLIATTLATSYTDLNVLASPFDSHFYVVTSSVID